MNNDFNSTGPYSDSQQEDLLDEIEVRCHTNVAAVRESTSKRTHVHVQVRAGNICERDRMLTGLQTSEVSTQGLSGIASRPVMVGSVFHLQFDRSTMDTPPTLAICDRCTLLGNDSFELRFRFAQAIDLTIAATGT